MPSRILREGILTSPRMAMLGWAEEVFYRRLHSVVDDFGRYFADPGLLRAACYPRQLNKVSDSDIGKWLQSIAAAGLVRVYPAQDGERYLEVLDFGQQIRAKKSKFPEATSVCIADAAHAHVEQHASAPVFVSEGVSEVVKPPPTAFAPPDWIPPETWAAYLAVRKTKRAGKDPHALGLIVKDLENFRAAGHDAIAILEASIKSCWVGVFEPKASAAAVKGVTVPIRQEAVYVPPPPLTEAEKAAAATAAKALRDKVHGNAAGHSPRAAA